MRLRDETGMTRNDYPPRTPPADVSLGRVLQHVFLRRGFVGMVGMTWGFMLGGALLMIWMTTVAALCGLSAFNTGSIDAAFGILTLAVYWIAANEEYREHNVVSLGGFLSVLFVSFVVSACIPLVLVLAAIAEQLDRRQPQNDRDNSRPRPTKEAQGVFAAVGQQMNSLLGRSAHNF